MRTITVTGHGSAGATPDTVDLVVGVRVRARSASAAMAEASAKQRGLVEALRAEGIGSADLQTRTMSCVATTDDRGARVTGYEVTSTVDVRSRDVGGAGALIDAVVQAAGDAALVHGISFSIRDDTALADEARAAAFDDARRKAEQHATRAGVVLGAVQSIGETIPSGGPSPVYRMAAAMAVEAGECTVRESLTVVFAIGE